MGPGKLPGRPAVWLPPAPDAKTRWLTREEAAGLIRAARKRREWRHVARLALIGIYTGTRPGAILALRWAPSPDAGWVDLDAGVMHRRGAGQRQSKKLQPPVRMPDRLLAHMRRWRRLDQGGPTPIADVVHYKGGAITKLRRSWTAVTAAAGIADATPHTLRHTAATWLMQSGVNVYEAAGFLGMSAATLEDVYGHHHPDFQGAAANASRGRDRAPAPAPVMHQKPPANRGISGPRASPNALK